jgi:hypothetical protein
VALVIDASTPAGVAASATQDAVTASFTPPDSPLLLALWAGNTFTTTVPAPSISSSPAQSWTSDVFDRGDSGSPTVFGQAALWHVAITGSPGASTVDAQNGDANSSFWQSLLKVVVLTGHDPVAPIGVNGGGRQNSGSTITQSFTASIDGGQGFMVICDWNANSMAGVSAASGCTLIDTGTIAGQISYITLWRTIPDETAGVSTSLGVTGLVTGGQYHWAYAEVISLAARQAAAGLPQGSGNVAAKHHAANW